MIKQFSNISYDNLNEFVYAHAKNSLRFSNGMEIGGGLIYPEVNFTLPSMLITKDTMDKVKAEYKDMIEGVCQRARELYVPGLVIEIELLPPLTFNPEWGVEVIKIVKDVMEEYQAKHNLPSLLRVTPVDVREGDEVEHMWHGKHWDLVMDTFAGSAAAGANLLAIESVGGKNVHDDAIMYGDIAKSLFALGVVAARDMEKLWTGIVDVAKQQNVIAAGDTACGFANTAMVLADKGYVPKVSSAVIRVISAVRSLVAIEQGAEGPHKDCGYEGIYVKAITGTPISMEGKTSACAHLSPVGNIAAAVADLWSNESVENVKLLGGMAPTIYLEQLAYDCRLMNTATEKGQNYMLRDLFVESDSKFDPQAYVLRPDVALRISKEIVQGKTHFERSKLAAQAAVKELKNAIEEKQLSITEREENFLNVIEMQLADIGDEEQFIAKMLADNTTTKFSPEKYDL